MAKEFEIAGEGLFIGRDGSFGVTDDYPGAEPWRFTGGTIRRVAVDVSGEETSTWSARPRRC